MYYKGESHSFTFETQKVKKIKKELNHENI